MKKKMATTLPRFGLSAPNAQWSRSELDTLSAAVGAHPTMLHFFLKWTENFRTDSFFFSSRRRHTRFKCDWSSDVCYSDLGGHHEQEQPPLGAEPPGVHHQGVRDLVEGLHRPVELAGAHPDPAAVERGVGAAVDDAAA